MRMFLVIVGLAVAACSVPAYAQQTNRYETYMEACKYRAAQTRRQIAIGDWTKGSVEEWLNDIPQSNWEALLLDCRTKESGKQIPPSAPPATVVERPVGEPQLIVKRPPGAPMGEFYRCNPQTFMPDASSNKICGPVKSKRTDI